MGSEVCPFCGKTYKRLKSHLPHCKAAARSKTPPSQHVAPRKQCSSPGLAAASPTRTAKAKPVQTPEAAGVQRSKNKNVPVCLSSEPSTTATSLSSSQSSNKKKQKLADQIKMASSASSSLTSPASRASTQPEHKSLRALIEETKTNPHVDFEPPKDVPEKTAPHTKKAARPPPVIRNAPVAQSSSRNDVWVESEGFTSEQLLVNSDGGQQGRITLQDVRATLRRAKAPGRTSALSIATGLPAADGISSKRGLVKANAVSEQPQSSSSSSQQLVQSAPRKSLLSEQAPLIPQRHNTAPQPEPNSPAGPLPSGRLSSQASQAAPLSNAGLTVGRHSTGLLSVPPATSLISSPLPFRLAPPFRVGTSRADDGSTKEELQRGVREKNSAEGPVTQRPLGRVRLKELPEWLSCNAPRTPSDLVGMMHRGWQWYHRRYIDVKKGGVGGVGMLLAGYCVLSYIWNYPHIKQDRWRKYH